MSRVYDRGFIRRAFLRQVRLEVVRPDWLRGYQELQRATFEYLLDGTVRHTVVRTGQDMDTDGQIGEGDGDGVLGSGGG